LRRIGSKPSARAQGWSSTYRKGLKDGERSSKQFAFTTKVLSKDQLWKSEPLMELSYLLISQGRLHRRFFFFMAVVLIALI